MDIGTGELARNKPYAPRADRRSRALDEAKRKNAAQLYCEDVSVGCCVCAVCCGA